MPKNDYAPGYDLLTLTKSQWRHLKQIERDHGIPWFVQIRNLVKSDMEGEVKGMLESIFKKLDNLKVAQPASGNFSKVMFEEEEQIKPSEMQKVDPNILSNGSQVGDLRTDLITEMRQAMGLPPLEEKRKSRMTDKRPLQVQPSSE